MLVASTCPLGPNGKYFSRELARGQTLENLEFFSDRLSEVYESLKDKEIWKQHGNPKVGPARAGGR